MQLAPIDWLDSDHVTCVSCEACPFLSYINRVQEGSEQLQVVVVAEARKQEDSSKLEEYRRVQEISL
jgi:hypothetical protein